MALKTETVGLSGLRPHPDNPRNGDIDAIVESLRANGQYAPLVIASDGTVLVGNHRYAAMLSMGWTEADVVRLPYGPRDEAALRVMLADNRTSDLARNDSALLLRLLDELDSPYGTAFASDAIDDLRLIVERDSTEPLDSADLAPVDDKYREQYGVIVICSGEGHQAEVYESLRASGYNARVVTT